MMDVRDPDARIPKMVTFTEKLTVKRTSISRDAATAPTVVSGASHASFWESAASAYDYCSIATGVDCLGELAMMEALSVADNDEVPKRHSKRPQEHEEQKQPSQEEVRPREEAEGEHLPSEDSRQRRLLEIQRLLQFLQIDLAHPPDQILVHEEQPSDVSCLGFTPSTKTSSLVSELQETHSMAGIPLAIVETKSHRAYHTHNHQTMAETREAPEGKTDDDQDETIECIWNGSFRNLPQLVELPPQPAAPTTKAPSPLIKTLSNFSKRGLFKKVIPKKFSRPHKEDQENQPH